MIFPIYDVMKYCFLFFITFPQKLPYNMFIHSTLANPSCCGFKWVKVEFVSVDDDKGCQETREKGLVGKALLGRFFSLIFQSNLSVLG